MDINNKIIAGFERIADVLKTLLWEKSKRYGISPIQIQILLFISSHDVKLCNVTSLAREFGLTKPTVSDAVAVLIKKDYLFKDHAPIDNRKFNLGLTEKGSDLIVQISNYDEPLFNTLKSVDSNDLNNIFITLTQIIGKLHEQGVIKVQRTCYSCRFYQNKNNSHFCKLLSKTLSGHEIRLDCPEYESKKS